MGRGLFSTANTDLTWAKLYVENSIFLRVKEKVYRLLKLAPGPGQYRAFSEFGIYESKNVRTEGNKSMNFSQVKNSPLKTSENF
jgi:hypothetical protein